MRKHLPGGCFGGQTVKLAQGFRLAVFDELVRPTDALDRSVDAGVTRSADSTRVAQRPSKVILSPRMATRGELAWAWSDRTSAAKRLRRKWSELERPTPCGKPCQNHPEKPKSNQVPGVMNPSATTHPLRCHLSLAQYVSTHQRTKAGPTCAFCTSYRELQDAEGFEILGGELCSLSP